MKILAKIKIGNLTYEIGKLNDSNSENYGKSSHSEQWIKLAKEFASHDKESETFLHEVIHQVLDQGKFFEESKDEKLVECLAKGLYQVLKDNNLLNETR